MNPCLGIRLRQITGEKSLPWASAFRGAELILPRNGLASPLRGFLFAPAVRRWFTGAAGAARIPPDTVVLRWSFLVREPFVRQARKAMDTQCADILSRIAPLGFSLEDLRQEQDAMELWTEWKDHRNIERGFETRRTWSLRFPVHNDKRPSLLEALAGSIVPCKISHELSQPDLLDDESLRLAVAKARRQALLMAQAAGVRLGRLVSLQRGELRIRSETRSDLECCEMELPQAKDIEGSETVTLTWEIAGEA